MKSLPCNFVLLVTASLCFWSAFDLSIADAQDALGDNVGRNPDLSDVERTAAGLINLLNQAENSINGESPDPTPQEDIRLIAQQLIDQLEAVDPASSDSDVGMGALSMLVFYAGQNDNYARRLGMENGLQDINGIDRLKELAVKAISSRKPSAQESGARILSILSPDDATIELKLVELLDRTTSYSTKEVTLFAIAKGGFDSDKASAAVVSAIRDPKIAPVAIRALDEAGEVPPEAVLPMIEIVEAGYSITTSAHAAEMLTKHFPGNQDLNRLNKLRNHIQSAESRVNAAIERLERQGIRTPE